MLPSSAATTAGPSSSSGGVQSRAVCCITNSTNRRPSSHRCKAVAREGWDSTLHQANLAADSLVAKSHECAQQYQGTQNIHAAATTPHHPQQHSSNITPWRATRSTSSSGSTSTSASASKRQGWPWLLFGRRSSSDAGGSTTSTTTAATTSDGGSSDGSGAHGTTGGRYSKAVSVSLLEQSAAAVSQQHARRGLTTISDVVFASSSSSTTASAVISTTTSTPITTDSGSSGSLSRGGSGAGSSSWEEAAAAALRTMEETWDSETDGGILGGGGSSDDGSGSSSGSTATQLFLYDVMPPAAAEAVAAEVTPSTTSSKLALLLGDTYPAAAAAAAAASSNGSGGSSSSSSSVSGSSADSLPAGRRQQQQQKRGVRSDGVWSGLQLIDSYPESSAVPVPNAAALRRSLKSVAPMGQPRPASSSSNGGSTASRRSNHNSAASAGSSSRSVAGAASSSSSPSSSADDEGDWLAAVLSEPTGRLSTHSNTVLTNSLKRLATLRSTAASADGANVLTGGGISAAAAAAAVYGAEGLLESIRERFHTFALAQFEEVALQLAQMGYKPDQEWLVAFERSSMSVMDGASPRSLSRLLLSRSKLAGRVSSEWCAACCYHMAAAPHKLSVSSWVNALYALVRLKYMPNRQFQTTFFASTAERLDDISPELLTHLVWSLSRLKLAPSHLWWRSLVHATASVEKPFSHAQLASLVHSVAQWAEPGGIVARDVQRLVDMLLVEIHTHLGLLQPAELTLVLWSLGSLVSSRKLRPDAELLDELLAAVQDQLPRLNPVQCSNLCWGLAKLNRQLPQGFPEALLLEVQAQLSGFSNSAMCNVLWALARLDVVPLAPFREQLWEELHVRIKSLALPDLSTLLWALAQLQLPPPDDILQDLIDATAVHISTSAHDGDGCDCDSTHLTNIVWALGRLQARPDREWLVAAQQASLKVLPTAGLTQVVNLVWGFSRLSRFSTGASSAASTTSTTAAPTATQSDHTESAVGGSAGHTFGDRGRDADSSPASSHSFFSTSWQAACLRELRLRCMCAGHDVECRELVHMLRELGVVGLAEGAAVLADQLFQDLDDDSACMLQFQPGCR